MLQQKKKKKQLSPKMADKVKILKYEVVSDLKKNLLCDHCKDLLSLPQATSCCQTQCCKDCIQQFLAPHQGCPFCAETSFTTINNTKLEEEVNRVIVKCPNTKLGCKWEGSIQKLQEHTEYQCLFTGEDVQKASPDSTEGNIVTCPYSILGCSEYFSSSLIATHLHTSTHKHKWLKDTFEHYLQHTEFLLQKKEKELEDKQLKLKQLQAKLHRVEEERNQMNVRLEDEIKTSEVLRKLLSEKAQELLRFTSQLQTGDPEYEEMTLATLTFTMTNFSNCWNQTKRSKWTSDHYFTHENGYRMCFEVDCPLKSVRVCSYLLPGPNDDVLPWPIKGTITISVVDQANTDNHWDYQFIYNEETPAKASNRVHLRNGRSEQCFSESPQLPLSDLYSSDSTRQYLVNNALVLAVTNVDIEKTIAK